MNSPPVDYGDSPYRHSEQGSSDRTGSDWYPREPDRTGDWAPSEPEPTGGWYPTREPGYPPAHTQDTYGPGRHYQSDQRPSHGRQDLVAARARDVHAVPGTRREFPAERTIDAKQNSGYWAATWAALIWYAVPLVLYVGWALLLRHNPVESCAADATDCTPTKPVGIGNSLQSGLPQILVALVMSASIAPLLRWCNPLWRSITVGFLAAVIGGGVATMIFILAGPSS